MLNAIKRVSTFRHPSSACTLHLAHRSTTTTTSSMSEQPVSSRHSTTTQGVLNLEDHGRLFASLTTQSLLSTLGNLYLMASGPAVDVGSAVVKKTMEGSWTWARKAVSPALKRTVFSHFCAGETEEEAVETLRAMWEDGLRGILDYGLEDAFEDDECDRNLRAFLSTVDTTTQLPPQSVSFACVKITALCPVSLLEKVSNLLRYHNGNKDELPWLLPSLPVLPTTDHHYRAAAAPPIPLSSSDENRLRASFDRLSTLCSACEKFDLPLLVDAEYSSVQPAIDHITYAAMLRFNHGSAERPLVYGTMQAYLRDSMDRLAAAIGEAERRRVPVGFKLVRGAYMSRERKEAAELGVESPVHQTIQETHRCYDDCAAFLLHKIADGSVAAVLATHNKYSGMKAADKVEELGIDKRNPRLEFAQLKGMAEALSLGLRNAGFNVSKYLAFGPMEKVIPYLLRRAEENKGVLSSSSHDRTLIRREVVKRLRSAVFKQASSYPSA